MVRSLGTATQNAIRDPNAVIPRNLVLITAKDADGDPVLFGFTDYGEDITTNIVDGLTGSTVSRTYYGDNAPIVDMDAIPMKVGLEVDTTQVVLNALHPAVQSMFRGHDIRNAPVQIHRMYLSLASMEPVAAPLCRRLGWINSAPETLGAVGQDSSLTLEIVSVTRELTRINSAKRSDETQRLRSGDRFRRYSGTAFRRSIWWGEAKAETA